MVRMRTAAQAYQEIKSQDPESSISERQIREIMKNGVVPVVRRGNRLSVNMDALLVYQDKPALLKMLGWTVLQSGIWRIKYTLVYCKYLLM